jgi:hypothetical protein
MTRHPYIGAVAILLLAGWAGCSKKGAAPAPTPTPVPVAFGVTGVTVNNRSAGGTYYNVNITPAIRFSFPVPIDTKSVSSSFSFTDNTGALVGCSFSYEKGDSTVVVQPSAPLKNITAYKVGVSTSLLSQSQGGLKAGDTIRLVTTIDSSDKFPRVTDSVLLDLVEQQTLQYFWTFGHPVSGLARERNTSGDVVTTGGSGFGVMALLAGIQRGFISRAQGLGRVQTVVNFLSTRAQRYHGAFAHWMNGATGATVAFSTQDDGADLVETAYMLQGLLTARQFFNSSTDPTETAVRDSINSIWNGVDWDWFRQGGQNTLYWHWSPDHNWSTNQTISGWNEALIVYVLAASAPVASIPKIVYDNGWAGNGSIRNGNIYYGVPLPLGPSSGGPLFFAHYSFLGIDPHGLSDAYANYWTQDTAHTRINYDYCVGNPLGYNGYSSQCWGLTASDDNITGYSAHSPTNDLGIISPTAAISSLPYTPAESMNALRFFYYTMGDKLWGQYGFMDAFNLSNPWFSGSWLAIDQGPEIVMIENYRSGLLWNLFMSCPEVKAGMKKLGFQGPML